LKKTQKKRGKEGKPFSISFYCPFFELKDPVYLTLLKIQCIVYFTKKSREEMSKSKNPS